MAEVKWIKITTGMFEDEKIDYIESLPDADAILVVWVKLLTLAGKCNAKGYIFLTENIPYTEDMLAHKLKRPLNTVRFALETFRRLGMIDADEKGIYVENWDKHQNLDALEKLREKDRLRKREERANKKLLVQGSSMDSPQLDIDKDLDKEKRNKDIYIVFDHWNGKKITVHKELNQKRKSAINARLDAYRVQDIIEAIDNYECVLRSDDYFWTYKWSLEDFMNPKNLDRFLEVNSPLINFRKEKSDGKIGGRSPSYSTKDTGEKEIFVPNQTGWKRPKRDV